MTPSSVFNALLCILYESLVAEKQTEMQSLIFGDKVESKNEASICLQISEIK